MNKTNCRPKRRNWDESYAALVAYKEQHGTVNVQRRYAKDPALAKWVGRQRTYQRKLTNEQRKKLTDIGFEFTRKQRHDELWNAMFVKLQRYKKRHFDCMVPTNHGPLGEWVHAQRQRYQRGLLSPERIEKLESVGFVWRVRTHKPNRSTETDDMRWQEKYLELVDHVEQRGTLKVGTKQNEKLHTWVMNQKYLDKQNQLREDRKQLLQSVGMDFDSLQPNQIYQLQWDQQFQTFVQQKKHGRVSDGTKRWLANQQDIFRNGDMEALRARSLIQVGVSPREEVKRSWNSRCQKLQTLMSMASRRASEMDKDPDLKRWAGLQRVLVQHQMLSVERKNLLIRSGFLADETLLLHTVNDETQNAAKRHTADTGSEKRPSPIPKKPSSGPKVALSSSDIACGIEHLCSPP